MCKNIQKNIRRKKRNNKENIKNILFIIKKYILLKSI